MMHDRLHLVNGSFQSQTRCHRVLEKQPSAEAVSRRREARDPQQYAIIELTIVESPATAQWSSVDGSGTCCRTLRGTSSTPWAVLMSAAHGRVIESIP